MPPMRRDRTLGARLHIAEHEETQSWTRQPERGDGGVKTPNQKSVALTKQCWTVERRDTLTRHTHFDCDKTFRFGNDLTTRCMTATVLPTNFAGRTGQLFVHVMPGGTPFLFPPNAHGEIWFSDRLRMQETSMGRLLVDMSTSATWRSLPLGSR